MRFLDVRPRYVQVPDRVKTFYVGWKNWLVSLVPCVFVSLSLDPPPPPSDRCRDQCRGDANTYRNEKRDDVTHCRAMRSQSFHSASAYPTHRPGRGVCLSCADFLIPSTTRCCNPARFKSTLASVSQLLLFNELIFMGTFLEFPSNEATTLRIFCLSSDGLS